MIANDRRNMAKTGAIRQSIVLLVTSEDVETKSHCSKILRNLSNEPCESNMLSIRWFVDWGVGIQQYSSRCSIRALKPNCSKSRLLLSNFIPSPRLLKHSADNRASTASAAAVLTISAAAVLTTSAAAVLDCQSVRATDSAWQGRIRDSQKSGHRPPEDGDDPVRTICCCGYTLCTVCCSTH